MVGLVGRGVGGGGFREGFLSSHVGRLVVSIGCCGMYKEKSVTLGAGILMNVLDCQKAVVGLAHWV